MNVSEGKKRRVGVWLDLDYAIKREIETYAGCQRFADEAGWDLIFDPVMAETLKSSKGTPPYDGVLGRVGKPLAQAARKAGIPAVNIWINSPAKEVTSVLLDMEASGVMAAQHLLGRGFREFGFLGFQRLVNSQRQLRGFRNTVREAGYRCNSWSIPYTLLSNDARRFGKFMSDLKAWIRKLPTPFGILVPADIYGRFLIDACRSEGLHVPGDVAVIGSDNEEVVCLSQSPSLTSIEYGHANLGSRAAALLQDLMDGAMAPLEPIMVPPAKLVRRQSTDVFAVDDPLVSRALRFMSDQSHLVSSVEDITAAVSSSRRTLERKFRESLGRSIAEEMTRLRLNRAKRLLDGPEVSLKEVAIDSGFNSAKHFGKAFVRAVGMTPTAYRSDRQSHKFPGP
jgi:LacI family transcriptional regulator